MDCRRTLGIGMCLLIGVVGCTHRDTTVPVVPPTLLGGASKTQPTGESVSMSSLPPGTVVKQLELPPRSPQAATCVAFGDWATKEAEAPSLSEIARKSKREDARKAYEQALSLDPHYLPAYLSLAQLYVAMKDHADAEATYRKATQLFPKEPRVFLEMGKCYGGEKQWEMAVQALRHAAELDPQSRPTIDELGWMQARAGHYDDSLTTFRRVYDEGEAHYKLAQMLDHLGDIDQCRQHLQVAVLYPKMDKAKALLAKLDAPGPDDGVKTASFVTAAKPSAPAVQSGPPAPSTASGVLLPPPPHIPIRYEEQPAAPSLPVVPGPPMN
jgi:Flp pilus assembly protein TadD